MPQSANKGSNAAVEMCGGCKRALKSDSLQCNICELWFDIKCSGADQATVNFLNSPSGKSSNVLWLCCSSCKCSSQKLAREIEVLQNKVENIEERVASLTEAVQKSLTQTKNINTGDNNLSAIVNEIRERESRSRNVIFTGDTSEEKIDAFLTKVSIVPVNVKKIGKNEKKTFLVSLPSESDKWKIIGKAKEICTSVSNFEGMYVNPDLTTRIEREEQFRLRKECRDRRELGENVKIKRGKVVVVK